MSEIVAFSGGKDSTAMALRLEEIEPDKNRRFLFTPTHNELPPMFEHMKRIKQLLGKERFLDIKSSSLIDLINEMKCIPNYRMRFCTRIIKIEPCIKLLSSMKDPVLCVGLRADEPLREGLYDEHVTNRHPLREWGWGVSDVLDYLKHRQIEIPPRTDCALCYYQRLIDWQHLWLSYPDHYEVGVQLEKKFGHTFRTPSKDKHPTSLEDLRIEFEKGWVPRYRKRTKEDRGGCRVCSM